MAVLSATVKEEDRASPMVDAASVRAVLVDRLILGAILIVWGARLAFVLTAPIEQASFRISDDAFYYFQVARHVVAGEGSTFDGINVTNGYHPLWMLCLLGLYSLIGTEPIVSLRAAFCLITLVATAGCWTAYRAMAAYAGRSAAVVGLLAMVVPMFLNPLLNGLETGLLIFLLFLTVYTARRYGFFSLHAGTGTNAMLGVFLALLFLCRLDSVFLVFAVFGVIILRGAGSKAPGGSITACLRKCLQVGLPALVPVLPYFAFNMVTYGHLVPISGGLKTTFPQLSLNLHKLTGMHAQVGQVQILFCSAMMVWLLVRSRRGNSGTAESVPDVLIAIWIGCLLHFANTVLFMNWGTHWWHYASYGPLTIILGSRLFAEVHARMGQSRGIAVGAGVLVLAGGLYALRTEVLRRGEHHLPWYGAAIWTSENLPDDAVMAMADCGLFGYFCRRPTVNLDGVINGYKFQEALKNRQLSAYLRGCGITHVADFDVEYTGEPPTFLIRLPARLYQDPGGAIVATPDAEVYQSEPYSRFLHESGGIRFAIWDVSRLRIVDDRAAWTAAGKTSDK